MGKKNFVATHYRPICNELYNGAAPTLKISYFGDDYVAGHNFAIVIMYHWRGKATWYNSHKGFKGRFLYVAFQDTNLWQGDKFEQQGNGVVHNHIFKDTFGEDYGDNKASVGGAGIKDGKLKFSSLFLNTKSSNDASYSYKWEADGSQYLSNEERALVAFATKMWMAHGKHTVHTIPSRLHDVLMGRRAGDNLSVDGVPLHEL